MADKPNPEPDAIVIRPVTSIDDGVRLLAAEATRFGFGHLERLVIEFEAGSNRFDQPGEILLGAFENDRLIATGGVNIDPYELGAPAARLRRLYVATDRRRNQIGTQLLAKLEAAASERFRRIQLYTPFQEASRFFVCRGYEAVHDRARVSHQKSLRTDRS